MARVTGVGQIKDMMDKYGSSGADFFTLKEDGDSAVVRFLHKDDNDLDVYVVHKVKLGDKEKYIECIKEEAGRCPLCEAGFEPKVRGFFQLIDFRDGKRKLWDRGKQEITSIVTLISKYKDLSKMDFEVKRNGKKGDNKTTYQFLPEATTKEIPIEERPEIAGPDKFVLTKSYEELIKMMPDISQPSGMNSGGNTGYSARTTSGTNKMF